MTSRQTCSINISTMMGRTMNSGSATTLNYLSRYNMTTIVTNNSKLLSTKDKSQKKADYSTFSS